MSQRQPVHRAWVDREAYIEAFESAFAADASVDLANFAPPAHHPLHLPVLEELVRIDLEHHWLRGEPRWLEDYFHRFPELFEASAAVRTLAFEEYRLRRQVGQAVRAEEYRERFGVDPSRGIRDDLTDTSDSNGTPRPPLDRFAQLAATLPRVGDVLLDYRLTADLGAGAFGRVFLAVPVLGGQPVALKVAPHVGGVPSAVTELHHPNIAPINSVLHSETVHAVVMPYRGATTLAHALKRIDTDNLPTTGASLFCVTRPGLPLVIEKSELRDRLAAARYADAAIWLAARLADGLAHAHGYGLHHRDLKPANVLVADDGMPMLLDFNMAAVLKPGEPAVTPSPGGTLPYMAPEQIDEFLGHRRAIDARADLYSLGVILFQLLTGRLPYPAPRDFSAERIATTLRLRLRPAPPIRAINPAVPAAAEAAVARLLHADPDWRPNSADDVAAELSSLTPDLPATAQR